MPTPLARIVASVRRDLEERKAAVSLASLEDMARRAAEPRDIRRAMGVRPGIIAEIKRASPSRGWIRRDLDAAETARTYVRAGACAVSVLTEGRFFGGTLSDLREASAASGDVPVLRKDFILDAYMLAEARAFGADLVLLMVGVLGNRTEELLRQARGMGLEPLVEVRDEREMEVAAASGATLVGINNRDLSTLAVDLGVSLRLLPAAPAGVLKVVESGIRTADDIRRFADMGADLFLVGEALVASNDMEKSLRALRGDTGRTPGP